MIINNIDLTEIYKVNLIQNNGNCIFHTKLSRMQCSQISQTLCSFILYNILFEFPIKTSKTTFKLYVVMRLFHPLVQLHKCEKETNWQRWIHTIIITIMNKYNIIYGSCCCD